MDLIATLIAVLVSFSLTRHFCNPASRLHILDHPNERSLHTRAVPRSGGVAVLGGLVAGGIVTCIDYPGDSELGLILAGLLPVAMVSFLDDRFGITPGVRMLVHGLAAAVLIGAGYRFNRIELPGLVWTLPPWVATLLTFVFIVWMINLYNFMDGMDGFAGGMAVIGFASLAALGWQADNALFGSISLLVAGASAGYLGFNFPPAKIFLGDTGSSTLGFLVATFSLWGNREGLFPLWSAVLIFSPFIVDATVTLGRRLLKREKIWLPHKTHYYQRLVQLGWGHRKTLLAEYVLMLACSLSALLALHLPTSLQLGLLAAWLLLYILLMLGVAHLERRSSRETAE
jgi:UDP-N-acetylmuramyl pentapeptide phosphotransferase/UDP-N-acetylglucosamine-1-phosphate transferase